MLKYSKESKIKMRAVNWYNFSGFSFTNVSRALKNVSGLEPGNFPQKNVLEMWENIDINMCSVQKYLQNQTKQNKTRSLLPSESTCVLEVTP